MAAHTTVDEVLKALDTVDFPADRDALIAGARSAGASGDVLEALHTLPPESYANGHEVAQSVRLAPADGEVGPGRQAQRQVPDAPRDSFDEDLRRSS